MELLQSWGALLSAFGALVAASGAWRTMGRIEGRVERWSERLDKHSHAIERYVVLFARLECLPEKFGLLSKKVDTLVRTNSLEHESMSKKIGQLGGDSE